MFMPYFIGLASYCTMPQLRSINQDPQIAFDRHRGAVSRAFSILSNSQILDYECALPGLSAKSQESSVKIHGEAGAPRAMFILHANASMACYWGANPNVCGM